MSSENPLVSIIIPTFNRFDKLRNCLKSIEQNSYKNVEVIVINDGKELPKYDTGKLNVKFVNHKKEVFWVKCRNEGAKMARGDLLFFVDDDNILAPNAIGALVKRYKTMKSVGLLGPIMYDAKGNLWFYGARAGWINPYPKAVPRSELSKELIETDVIPNAYMISKDLYIKIGMEDPEFLHHEEFDLAQRLKLAGYKSYIYTKASTLHDFGSTKSRINELRVYITIKSHVMIEKKYAPKLKFVLFLLIFIPINTLYYLFYKIPASGSKEKSKLYKAYLKGLMDGLNHN